VQGVALDGLRLPHGGLVETGHRHL
jgi:hypothetical protein